MPFKSKLNIQHIPRTELFKLLTPLIYITWAGERRETPKGFIIDGHSYPPILDGILGNPIASETLEASVNHDHDCQEGIIPRVQADREYSQAMADLGWNFKEKDKSFIWKFKRVFRRKRNWLGVRLGAFFKGIARWIKKR